MRVTVVLEIIDFIFRKSSIFKCLFSIVANKETAKIVELTKKAQVDVINKSMNTLVQAVYRLT